MILIGSFIRARHLLCSFESACTERGFWRDVSPSHQTPILRSPIVCPHCHANVVFSSLMEWIFWLKGRAWSPLNTTTDGDHRARGKPFRSSFGVGHAIRSFAR